MLPTWSRYLAVKLLSVTWRSFACSDSILILQKVEYSMKVRKAASSCDSSLPAPSVLPVKARSNFEWDVSAPDVAISTDKHGLIFISYCILGWKCSDKKLFSVHKITFFIRRSSILSTWFSWSLDLSTSGGMLGSWKFRLITNKSVRFTNCFVEDASKGSEVMDERTHLRRRANISLNCWWSRSTYA